MKMHVLISATALALLSALATTAPANATLFCEVVKTRDNFVALRAAPDAAAKLLVRMKAGDEILLAGEKRNGWEKVRYWPNGDRIEKGESAHSMTGWVNGKLVDACG